MTPFQVKALYSNQSQQSDDLPFTPGQVITVTEVLDAEWYQGEYTNPEGQQLEGIFPINYVEKVAPAAPLTRPAPKASALSSKSADSTALQAPIPIETIATAAPPAQPHQESAVTAAAVSAPNRGIPGTSHSGMSHTPAAAAARPVEEDDWGSAEEDEFEEKEVHIGAPKPASTSTAKPGLAHAEEFAPKPDTEQPSAPAAIKPAAESMPVAEPAETTGSQHTEKVAAVPTLTGTTPNTAARTRPTTEKTETIRSKTETVTSKPESEPKPVRRASTTSSLKPKLKINPQVEASEAKTSTVGVAPETEFPDFKTRMARFNQPQEEHGKFGPEKARRFDAPKRSSTFGSTFDYKEDKPSQRSPNFTEEERPIMSLRERMAQLQMRQEEETQKMAAAEERQRQREEQASKKLVDRQKELQAAGQAAAAAAAAGNAVPLPGHPEVPEQVFEQRLEPPEVAGDGGLHQEQRQPPIPGAYTDPSLNAATGVEGPASEITSESTGDADVGTAGARGASDVTRKASVSSVGSVGSAGSGRPPVPMSPKADTSVQEEQQPEEEEEEAEARRIALRERMARLSGGMGMPLAGMFMGGRPPNKQKVHRELDAMSKEEREREEARLAYETASPVSIMGGMGQMDPALLKKLGLVGSADTPELPEDSAEPVQPVKLERVSVVEADAPGDVAQEDTIDIHAVHDAKPPGPVRLESEDEFASADEAKSPRGKRSVDGFEFESPVTSAHVLASAPGIPQVPAAPAAPAASEASKVAPPCLSAPAVAEVPKVPAAARAPAVPKTEAQSSERGASPPAPAAPAVPATPQPLPGALAASVAPSDLADEEDNTDSEAEHRSPAPERVPARPPAVPRVPMPLTRPLSTSSADADVETDVQTSVSKSFEPSGAPPVPPVPSVHSEMLPNRSQPPVPLSPPQHHNARAAASVPHGAAASSGRYNASPGPPPPGPPPPGRPGAPPSIPRPAPPATAPSVRPVAQTSAPASPGVPYRSPPVPPVSAPPAPTGAPPVPAPPAPPTHAPKAPAPPAPPTPAPALPAHAPPHQANPTHTPAAANKQPGAEPWYAQAGAVPPEIAASGRPYTVSETLKTEPSGAQYLEREIVVTNGNLSKTIVRARLDPTDPSSAQIEQSTSEAPQIDQATLKKSWERFGENIVTAAHARPPSTAAAIASLLNKIPGLVPPSGEAFGAVVYENFANASVRQIDEIRPGDVVVFDNAYFQGTKSPLQKYHRDMSASYIVLEWDGNKKKLRLVDTKKDGVRVADLRRGSIRIYRPMGKDLM